MDTFIITGANAEPAQSIARRLCEMGARVYGIAGTFPETDFAFNEFFPVACDITDTQALNAEVQKILEREKTISGVIFSPHYLTADPFEAMPLEELTLGINALVTAPLLVARLALPSLVRSRGCVIAISQNTTTPHGHVLNSIADATMKVFAGTLFAELRDTGVKTCHIFLQNNSGTPDPAAQFTQTPQSRIQPDIVAETVETVLRLRENNALTQIVLRPQATRETPRIPISSEPRIRTLQVVRLPESKNYPPAEEPILTPKYRRPDYAPPRGQKALEVAEEAVLDAEEFADDYVDPELRYLVKEKQTPKPQAQNPHRAENAKHAQREEAPESLENAQPALDENGNPMRKKRKRRRNRKKNRNGAMIIQPPNLGGQGEKTTSNANVQTPQEAFPTQKNEAPRVPEKAPAEKAVSSEANPAKTEPRSATENMRRDETPREKTVENSPGDAEKPNASSGKNPADVPTKKTPKKARSRTKKADTESASDSSAPAEESKPKKARKPRAPKKKSEPKAQSETPSESAPSSEV